MLLSLNIKVSLHSLIYLQTVTKNAHKMADIITAKPEQIPSLSPKDLFHLVSGFGFLHLLPHSELLYILEPYIVQKLSLFTADELNYVTGFYIRMQRGSKGFVE